MWAAAVLAITLGLVTGLEIDPTAVQPTHDRTSPPTQAVQYAQTLYKSTDHSTVMNTIQPLWPSYEVEYSVTSTSTVNNQTIATTAAEFSTVLNSTVEYNTKYDTARTWDVAATSYQTMDFQHQKVMYTNKQNETVTEVQENDLPFV